jgi:sugar phosphate isomerase/epimerase
MIPRTPGVTLASSRREFIRIGAAAAVIAGASAPSWLRGRVSTPGKISLGFGLYGMKTLPLPEALSICARIGYENVELCFAPGFPAEPSRLSRANRAAVRQQLAALNLFVSAGMPNLNLFGTPAVQADDLETIKRCAEVLHDLGVAGTAPLETILGGKSAEWEQSKQRALERLRAWTDTAVAAGVTMVVKAHAGQAVDTPERLLWMIRGVNSPALAVDYDHSHFELRGFTLEDSLRTLGPYIRFVTVKESKGTAEHPHFLLPGDGHTNFKHYFKVLRDVGYAGPVVVEVSAQIFSQKGYDPTVAAQRSYAALAPGL